MILCERPGPREVKFSQEVIEKRGYCHGTYDGYRLADLQVSGLVNVLLLYLQGIVVSCIVFAAL